MFIQRHHISLFRCQLYHGTYKNISLTFCYKKHDISLKSAFYSFVVTVWPIFRFRLILSFCIKKYFHNINSFSH